MTRRRWIADEVSGSRAALTGEHARHLAEVLRARVGQAFEISTGSELRHGEIVSVHPDRVEFALGRTISHPERARISVALSIFKFDRMELAIEKCTELGVAHIVPVIAARTEPHLAAAANKRVDRWRRIAREASEQARRISPPTIDRPVKLKEAITLSEEQRVVLSEMEKQHQLKDAISPEAESVLLAFGPEGGWKQVELDLFHQAGWRSASLGGTILRTETAAIAAVAIALSVFG
jgi:16S rRNA (uracil1498-N3)-methyltransferase